MEKPEILKMDGSIKTEDGVFLPVSLGLPYKLAALLGISLNLAFLAGTRIYGTTILETWRVRGQVFEVAQDERFIRAELNIPIGSVKGQVGEHLLVFQQRPPQI